MTLTTARRLPAGSGSGGGGQSSGAAAAYLMGGVGPNGLLDESFDCGDDDSCIFPSSASLAASSVVGGSRYGGGGGGNGGHSRKGGHLPMITSQQSLRHFETRPSLAGTSFEESECGGSVVSTFSRTSVSVVSTASGSPRRRSYGYVDQQYRMSSVRHVDDDDMVSTVSGLTSCVSAGQGYEASSSARRSVTTEKVDGTKSFKKHGRGRGAMKSLSKSLRSRSPGKKQRQGGGKGAFEQDARSLEGGDRSSRPDSSPGARSSSSAGGEQQQQQRRRSRTRSPLRKVAHSIGASIKKGGKNRRRSRSADAASSAHARLGAFPSSRGYSGERGDVKAEAAKLMMSASKSDYGDYGSQYKRDTVRDDDSISLYSVGSAFSHSTAPCSVGASSVASAPTLRTPGRHRRTASGGGASAGVRRVESASSLLLPSLIREDECDHGHLLNTSHLGASEDYSSVVSASATRNPPSPLRSVPPSVVAARQNQQQHHHQGGQLTSEESSVDRPRRRRSLLQKAKNKSRSFRKSRRRSGGGDHRGDGDSVSCSDSVSVMTDVTAPGRMQGVETVIVSRSPRKTKDKAETGASGSPSVPAAPTPVGLTGRMSTELIASHVRAGSGSADAVRRLREMQAGLTTKSLKRSTSKSKLLYTSIAGVSIPDYTGYVEASVGRLRRSMGVSDEDYEAIKDGLLGFAYYGNAV
eukprot:CAMPEP_0197467032 /NCGR_PEP_ID=MMETSP1175-20131217/65359_1 /TAXON_ID=1003142 /ORGANISM="Triceratium dubium, Strain CCMP147" /LENGTH=692 /DNA_ID=CAMNT_0043003093 /DNA_START=140 /DNA_END=2218 /DNA_ORIENTATION=+